MEHTSLQDVDVSYGEKLCCSALSPQQWQSTRFNERAALIRWITKQKRIYSIKCSQLFLIKNVLYVWLSFQTMNIFGLLCFDSTHYRRCAQCVRHVNISRTTSRQKKKKKKGITRFLNYETNHWLQVKQWNVWQHGSASSMSTEHKSTYATLQWLCSSRTEGTHHYIRFCFIIIRRHTKMQTCMYIFTYMYILCTYIL